MPEYLAYVANTASNTVSVCVEKEVLATIPVGKGPRCIALTPDESFAYVTDYQSNDVAIIDTSQNKVIHLISEVLRPTGIAIGNTVHGTRVYVGANVGPPGYVYVIDPASDHFVARIAVGDGPAWVAITAQGTFVYVTNFNANSVSVIDTATNTVVKTIAVCSHPLEIATTRVGKAYLVPQCMNLDFKWIVQVIDQNQQKLLPDVPLDGIILLAVAAHPEGTQVYVTEFTAGVGWIVSIDTKTDTVSNAINIGVWPKGAACSRDGAFCFVSDYSLNTLRMIEPVNLQVVATTQLGPGNGPFGVAVKTRG